MKLFIAEIEHDLIKLSKDESNHLVKVLRAKVGEEVYVTNGKGTMANALVEVVHPKESVLRIKAKWENYNKRPYFFVLAIAPTKSMDRFEFVLEKSVELGIDEIHPIFSFHSERKNLNIERCKKIIESAVKQSQKAFIPKFHEPIKYKDFLIKSFNSNKYIAHCNSTIERTNFKLESLEKKNSMVLIGPEGDFSDQEIQMAIDTGYKSISLGNERLRTETAAIHIASVLNWEHKSIMD